MRGKPPHKKTTRQRFALVGFPRAPFSKLTDFMLLKSAV
jgi:hypothetical protein